MDILMRGNGFDIEHGLPTTYADFLQFVERFNYLYTMAKIKFYTESKIEDEYLRFIIENPETNADKALHEYLKDNIWIDHLKRAYKEHLKNKEDWIDFESEISQVIQNVDELYHAYMEKDEEFYVAKINHCRGKLPGSFFKYLPHGNGIGNLISIMQKDLNRLIGALEIYIFDYIDNWGRIEYYNPDIDAIHPDAILSFNYSNTWKRVYEYNRENVKYSFIHGKARSTPYVFCMDECIDKNQMVLGIDEYLSKDRKNKEVEFIAFKKYYQRIYKKTGNEYKSWLVEIDKERKEGKKKRK